VQVYRRSQRVHSGMSNEMIRMAVEQLVGPEREAIRLAYFEGNTYREVARLLGEAEGTIKSRMRTGLQHMREAVGRWGAELIWEQS